MISKKERIHKKEKLRNDYSAPHSEDMTADELIESIRQKIQQLKNRKAVFN
jgi:hypothetical protein